ncbi:MAG TPA: alpha/beta hydrolase [Gammaproteobacteria bacterium]|nr:alpha/beta hydrolase [Gammaproteobacteria bacterium]
MSAASSRTPAAPTERQFDLPGLTLAAQVWGSAGDRPILAAHGWLDNAATFDRLAPLLPGCEIVALDLAGHGRSGSRSADAGYNVWQDVGDFLGVLDELGWARCTLLGHSRGGAIAMLFAATFPERVDKLVLIEGGAPMIGAAADAPATLRQALLDRRSLLGKSGRVFAERAKAIQERAQGFTKLSIAAAEVLARRSLNAVPGGFQWHADQRLKGASELRLTAEHVREFVRRVTAPVLLVLADDGPFVRLPIYEEMIGLFASVEVVRLAGGHHLHLEGAEIEIARRIQAFLG